MEERRIQLEEELKKAEEAYQQSISDMQAIFSEELYRRETEGPFTTEAELDNFNNYYMNQKQLQNEVFLKCKRHLEDTKRSLITFEKKSTAKKEETKAASSKEIIKFKPLDEKLSNQPEEVIEELPEERLVIPSDIKTLVPIGTIKSIVPVVEEKESEKLEEEPVAKKVDLKELPEKEEKPIWESSIEFPEETIPEEDIKIPEFPRFPFEEIEKLLGKEQKTIPTEEKKEVKLTSSEDTPEEIAEIEIIELPPIKETPKEIEEIEIIELPPTEEKKPRAELVEEFIRFYDEPKDKLTATNVEASKEFKEELKSNNFLYNLVKKTPKFIKAPFKMLKKLGDRIIHSVAGKIKAKKIREKILAYTDEDILILNEEFQEKGKEYPTLSKVMLADTAEEIKFPEKEATPSVGLPTNTIESLNEQINDAFRKLGKTEDEIAKINSEAEAKAKAKVESQNKGYCTTEEEILEQVEIVLNERKSKNSSKK